MTGGIFITLEGGEGAGKSTQIALLADALRRTGRAIVVTREPGGCPEAEALRELLLHRPDLQWGPVTQALLVTAARRAHYTKVIKPALEADKIVLCDRFFDSTLAYQGYGLGVERTRLEEIHHAALHSLQPDITFLLDIDVGKGLSRARARGAAVDMMESKDVDFHERLRRGYLEIAEGAPGRIHVIDADDSPENVQSRIRDILERRLGVTL